MKGNSVFEHTLARDCSPVWKGIIGARAFIWKGVCFELGICFDLNHLVDPWISTLQGGIPCLKKRGDLFGIRRVVDLKEFGSNYRNIQKLQDIFVEDSVKAILQIPWPNSVYKLIWRGNES